MNKIKNQTMMQSKSGRLSPATARTTSSCKKRPVVFPGMVICCSGYTGKHKTIEKFRWFEYTFSQIC